MLICSLCLSFWVLSSLFNKSTVAAFGSCFLLCFNLLHDRRTHQHCKKTQGLNTVTNKLNKITWGLGQLETPGDTNKLKKTTKDYKTWHKTAHSCSLKTRETDRNHYNLKVIFLFVYFNILIIVCFLFLVALWVVAAHETDEDVLICWLFSYLCFLLLKHVALFRPLHKSNTPVFINN